jgi:hypothetical protein
MSLLDGIKAEIDKLNTAIQRDEAWVVAEINKGWQLLESVGHTVDVDIKGIFQYIATHQQQIVGYLHSALSAMTTVGLLFPATSPAAAVVQTALTAINAATAATNVLGQAVVSGSTPLATAVDAFHALKDAQTAVNAVVKQATAKPGAKS